ncbi:MAG: glycosyltransferase family 39 protein [Bacteroidetes bacterium]|nr:glycosyltransferase family 39 protein [Bacteroidota bacterium]
MLKNFLLFIAPVLVSFLLHLHTFNLDLVGIHVWRQTQTQTVIYNFSFSDNNIFHPQKFDLTGGSTALLYEFPVYQWLIAQVNDAFGYSVMHSRLITFLFFVFFLWGFYKLLRHFFKREIALIVNALICFSPLLYYYCVNPLPDTLALACAAWSLYFFFGFLKTERNKHIILFCLFVMLAALIKLPYILFGGVYVLYNIKLWKEKNGKALCKYGVIFLLFLTPVLLWYAYAMPTWKGNGITSGIISNTTPLVNLLDYFWHALISDVPEMLTNYASCIFLVVGIVLFFRHRKSANPHQNYFILLFFLLSAYYFFELNMIENKHEYYLMPFLILIFLVVAAGVRFFYESRYKKFVFVIVCLVPLTAWLRINHRWNVEEPGFFKDYLTEQKAIHSVLPQNAICIIDYDNSKFIALYYLKRQGYSLLEHELNAELLNQFYHKGAQYLITQNVSFNETMLDGFNTEILFNKELKIYKLNLK